jgi:hypothetical protein
LPDHRVVWAAKVVQLQPRGAIHSAEVGRRRGGGPGRHGKKSARLLRGDGMHDEKLDPLSELGREPSTSAPDLRTSCCTLSSTDSAPHSLGMLPLVLRGDADPSCTRVSAVWDVICEAAAEPLRRLRRDTREAAAEPLPLPLLEPGLRERREKIWTF